MELVLHGAPLSPFVRKVRVALALKGCTYTLDPVDPFRPPEGYRAINPLLRVPALSVDGRPLCDSSVICQYLDELHPAPALLPAEPFERARVRWFEKYADYELAPLMTVTAFAQRLIHPLLGRPVDTAAIRTAVDEKLPPLLDHLEAELGGRDWLVGSAFTLADLAFASQCVNFAHSGHALDAGRHPALAALAARACALPVLAGLITEETVIVEKIRSRIASR